MDRFIFNYNGNKYLETKKYLSDFVDNCKYDYIAEPCGGIFGFSRYHFLKHRDNDNIKYLINDIDKNIIKFYNDLKNNFDGTINYFIDYKNKLYNELELSKETNDKKLSLYLRNKQNKTKYENYILKLICAKNLGMCGIDKFETKINNFLKKKEDYIKMFSKCEFSNLEFNDFIKKTKKYKNILYYIDPPYFNSCNTEYAYSFNKKNKKNYIDGTTIYLDIYKLMNNNKNCLFVMNKIDVLNYIFKKFFYQEYKGKYQITKNTKVHIIYLSKQK